MNIVIIITKRTEGNEKYFKKKKILLTKDVNKMYAKQLHTKSGITKTPPFLYNVDETRVLIVSNNLQKLSSQSGARSDRANQPYIQLPPSRSLIGMSP